jgi:lactate permease
MMMDAAVWKQVEAPVAGNLGWSALVAVLPIVALGLLLVWRRWSSVPAVAASLALALVLCVGVWGMPLPAAGGALLYGALYALLPIGLIVVAAVLLFNLVVASGRFEVVKASLTALSPERPVQVLVVAYAFGALLEGAAGYGTPVAIGGAILVGLGLTPVRAAVVALLANTAPVAYGSLGIPVLVGVELSGRTQVGPTTAAVAILLPLMSLSAPIVAVAAACGWRDTVRAWPVILPAIIAYTGLQFATAMLTGPALPDVVAGIGTFLVLLIATRLRHRGESTTPMPPIGDLLRAWGPFMLLTGLVILWGIPEIKAWLKECSLWKWHIPGLDHLVARPDGKPLDVVYKLEPFAMPGTAIVLAVLLSVPVLGLNIAKAWTTTVTTLASLLKSLLAIVLMLAFATVMNYGGPAATLGACLAVTGQAYPFIAPILGWIGVFLTGSDTSSNAIFGGMQTAAADKLGLPPALGLGANTAGGGVGKMISPQSIAIATGAVGAKGQDADILRGTLGWSLVILALVCLGSGVMAWLAPHLPIR